MQKLKKLLTNREEMMEMIRYLIAGGLTTVLSIALKYGSYIALSEDHTVNGADPLQMVIGNAFAWIIAVIFAFWINRGMVFRVQGGTKQSKRTEFLQFVGARLVSWAAIEEGVALLIQWIGVSNLWNVLIVTALVTIFNYVVSKFWIFKPKAQPGIAVDAEAKPTEPAEKTND
jgi:putative flippase GtrA